MLFVVSAVFRFVYFVWSCLFVNGRFSVFSESDPKVIMGIVFRNIHWQRCTIQQERIY